MTRASGDTTDMTSRADISLSYNLSLMAAYFRAKKVEERKSHNIVSVIIIEFILTLFCSYVIFLGVTGHFSKIFDKMHQDSRLQNSTERFRSIIEGARAREALIHEKCEDVRIVHLDLQKCQQSHKESLDFMGLQNTLQESTLQTDEIEKPFLQRLHKRYEHIRKLEEKRIKTDRISASRDLLNTLLVVSTFSAIVYFGINHMIQNF